MKKWQRYFLAIILLVGATAATAEVTQRTANNGQLIMEDVPAIPEAIVTDLNRYLSVRSAYFLAWQPNSDGIYVSTRFADVSQIHRVDKPGGARHQLTFNNEPAGGVQRQPHGSALLFSRDAGGSEFAQLFLLDPAGGAAQMLTDGESRNGSAIWDRAGNRIAYGSTRRNGASNDIWLMDVSQPEEARLVFAAPDGTGWYPTDFTVAGAGILVANYVSITDSRIYLLDLDSGAVRLLVGGENDPSSNVPQGLDHAGAGFWLVTNSGSEFSQLAWQSLEVGAQPEIITADIKGDVGGLTMSEDRQRGAFTVSDNGMTRLYLIDLNSRQYRLIKTPVGLIGGLAFSPDGSQLAMTLNTSETPSDSFVLALGQEPLEHGALQRWTYSEVGGLNTETFVSPQLIEFPTFDKVDGEQRKIPAWYYKPPGDGPFPVVISIHGGPEGQSRPAFSSTYQMWLQKLGVAILVPNVRGSSGYGKTYLGLDNGFKREDSVKDIGRLLDWIAEQPELDKSRVAVFGGSYGGYMVLASAVHFSDRLRAAVDVVGISNFVTFLENTQDYRRDLRRVEYGDERDPEMRAFLQKISPLNNVEKITIPMLVVQGQNDPRVPVTEAEQMVSALRAQQRVVWYMNALNEGHGYRRKENRDIYQQAIALFLREHLVGD